VATALRLITAVGLLLSLSSNSWGNDSLAISKAVAGLRLKFLENKGQMRDMKEQPVPNVLFKAEAPGVDLYVTTSGLTWLFFEPVETDEQTEKEDDETRPLRYERVDMELVGAAIDFSRILKSESQEGHFSYFYPHCPEGIFGVKSFARIEISEIYPGIDWILYNSNEDGFKYDFVVRPEGDATDILLRYFSSDKPQLNKGKLQVPGRIRTLVDGAPVAYLQNTGVQIRAEFVFRSEAKHDEACVTEVGINLGQVSPKETVVIDPLLTWGTFYGGNNYDGVLALDTDGAGNLFAVGYTGSSNFPTFNAGTFYQAAGNQGSQFIIKLTNAGVLAWATCIGTISTSGGLVSLALDPNGNVFVCGSTWSGGMPVHNAGTYFQSPGLNTGSDAFIAKFNGMGALLWATHYGGNGTEYASACEVDFSGNLFVTGVTSSTNFPTQNAGTFYQATIGTATTQGQSAFMLKFDNSGTRLWATYFGYMLNPNTIAVDLAGSAVIAGEALSTGSMTIVSPGSSAWTQSTCINSDIFLAKFLNNGTLVWSSYYGGSAYEGVLGLKTDNNNNIFVTGTTASADFPVLNSGTFFQLNNLSPSAPYDAYILKFTSASVRTWASFLGGSGYEQRSSSHNLCIDYCGNIYVSIETLSTGLPMSQGCPGSYTSASADGTYLCRFTNNGTLNWATYIGGNGYEFRCPITVDANANLYLSGEWIDPSNTMTPAITPTTYPLIPAGIAWFDNTHNGGHDTYFVRFSNIDANQFTYPIVCMPSATLIQPVLAPSFVAGGNFSSSIGLNLNPVTGVISSNGSLPGIYTVTYVPSSSATCDCDTLATSVATVQLSQLSATSSATTICAGSTVQLAANAISSSPIGYYWYPSGPTGSAPIVAPSVSIIYTLLIVNSESCVAVAHRSITVVPLPVVGISGETIKCAGDAFTLAASGAYSYYWTNGCVTPNCTVTINSALTLTVFGYDVNGCVNTATVQLNVSPCASFHELEPANTLFRVFPNPSSDEVIIEGANKPVLLRIISESGRELLTRELLRGENAVLKGLPRGLYLVVGRSEDGVESVKLVIE
jgi:hypothetical protein